ncbi:hypothetical protein llap_17631 [Limosa lapponica baueri]|uniref:Uncharacterized protein n=1 Tax=Limosa lapponica baueri TaxID=1758121 RepID=A0A2I0TE33_LIMLA|nr:hypothetical protein llap_17631 [Limosa lapponica baueri]
MLWSLALSRLLFICVGVATVTLAIPRPHQHLSRELLAPVGSLRCPAVSLPQETLLYNKICLGSRAACLSFNCKGLASSDNEYYHYSNSDNDHCRYSNSICTSHPCDQEAKNLQAKS